MLKHLPQTSERIQQFTEAFRSRLYPEERPLAIFAQRDTGRIAFAQAVAGPWEPAAEGETFGPRWSRHWLRIDWTIPPEWRGREVHLRVQSAAEMLLFNDQGRALQGLVSMQWSQFEEVRSHHRLTTCAEGGETATHYLELSITGLMGFWNVPDSWTGTEPGVNGLLRSCRLAVFDREAWDLYNDLHVLDLLGRQLPEGHQLRLRALTAANAIVNAVRPEDRGTWPDGRAIARDFFAANRGARRFEVSAVGHGHLDTAWLWQVGETIGKAARTFSSQLELMERYPEHLFACSQAQQLAWMKEHYPELFERLREMARAGRFLPCGGTWIEPDCNIPSGESLVRQFLLGQRFFAREFGERCREFWNPDVFGYSAAMPQIMRGAGIDAFLTQKLSWNQFNKPISSTFEWEGLDGSRVLTHFPPADTYNGSGEPRELFHSMEKHRDLERCTEAYYLFGHGDGGCGPTEAHLERLRRLADLDGMPRVEMRPPREFFARCRADVTDPLRWVGELYFELHRGTYTTQAATKRDNRRTEETLHDAELLATLARLTTGADYPTDRLTRSWELTCLNQFHDIIPGSSIREVYEDSARDYSEALDLARAVRAEALDRLHPPVAPSDETRWLAWNTLAFPRTEIVETPDGPVRLVAPALGYAVGPANTPPPAPVRVEDSGETLVLANGLIRAVVDPEGHLISLRDLRHDRECIAPGHRANAFVLHDDVPLSWEAWDVDIFHLEKRHPLGLATRPEITGDDPLLGRIAFTRQLTERSRLTQTITLRAGSPQLEFSTTVDWHEERRFLKVEFPLLLRSDHATYEIQFGHVRRPTHFNTSWDWARFEVCAHRWADLSEPDFGVALLNDCKYGHACHGNVLRLSLLRAPTWPDPGADRGAHTFRYALLPHAHGPQAGGVIPAAAAFNQPLLLRPTDLPAGTAQSYLSAGHDALVIDTVKRAEDGDAIVVRLYESHGSHVETFLQPGFAVRRVRRANLLEDAGDELPLRGNRIPLTLRPFEILTLLVEPLPDSTAVTP